VSGRAARNVEGRVIFYADIYTNSIKKTIAETNRRREIQKEYNKKHNITPASIVKGLTSDLAALFDKDYVDLTKESGTGKKDFTREELFKHIKSLEKEMKNYAKQLKFEKAAELRDKIKELKQLVII
jgi:excinuclease ABC subunit B